MAAEASGQLSAALGAHRLREKFTFSRHQQGRGKWLGKQGDVNSGLRETGKDTTVRAARHHQTQSAMTATESLWALYSGDRQSENTVGSPPTDHLPFSFQARLFITGNKQGVVRALKFRED